jgi:putative ABC transport system ATP-binding protein
MALLEAKNVMKVYRTRSEEVMALRDISFAIEPGQFVALVGKSGGGKSTLLNLCGVMDFPTSGEIWLDGAETSHLSDVQLTAIRREKVGFVFQSFQLLHTLSAVENVELPLLLGRQSNARQIALERLRWVKMETYADRLIHQLSGGQQQRIAIARALANSPRIMLADEPTGNLDTATGELVLNLLVRTSKEFGVAVVMATHSLESAALADRIFRLKDGQLSEAAVSR